MNYKNLLLWAIMAGIAGGLVALALRTFFCSQQTASAIGIAVTIGAISARVYGQLKNKKQ